MATTPTTSSTSRRPRESTQREMAVGSYRRQEEIGRGSFATVYKASMTVSDPIVPLSVPLSYGKVLSLPLLYNEMEPPSQTAEFRQSFYQDYANEYSLLQKKPGYVAIKSVDLHKLNRKLKENLYSEIDILKGLHHPHIVALIDCKEDEAHIHLIMEFCELGDLSYFIKKRDTLAQHDTTADMIRKYPNPTVGGLNEVIVRHFLKQLASALEFLRAKNFIHRDVKPQNLLLDPSPLYYAKAKPEAVPYAAHDKSLTPIVGVESLPTLKLADFGFARSLPSTSLAETLCGSPLYMAPEILRYEKYDAKADLWSVGTVLYEMMVGKPPFKASNHVELLRKIERGEDRIRFPQEVSLSDSMKKLIRGLLARHPVERIGFADFFNNSVVKDEIPGLAEEDRPAQLPKSVPEPTEKGKALSSDRQLAEGCAPAQSKIDAAGILSQSPRRQMSGSPKTAALRNEIPLQRRFSGTPPRTASGDLREKRHSHETSHPADNSGEPAPKPRRPSMVSHATAPSRPDMHAQAARNTTGAAPQRRTSKTSISSTDAETQEQVKPREQVSKRREDTASREAREARERAAQDVAFERDYVVVDKQAVQVNAFADELAASPRIHSTNQAQNDANRGAMVRRATTQVAPSSGTGTQITPSRAMQIASGRRPDQVHHRQNSYERRLRDTTSATSAISKAIHKASGRLFNIGFSPPLNLGRGGFSPPSYSPFPAYPINQANLLTIDDGSKAQVPQDEDSKAVYMIEESAHRSDVVFGFAEVKYKQLTPLPPSTDQGLGLRQAGIPEGSEGEQSNTEDDGLTVDAIVTLSEEALVLYVKALSLLARSMDIAGTWWARKNRGEIVDESASPRSLSGPANAAAVGNRVNGVVQWVRDRFNDVLGKAEYVRLKLIEAQKQLPPEHPGHPSNHMSTSNSTGMGTSGENVVVTSGVTAEKLMYDRALEMSKSAAVSELCGDDLPGCEMAYITAIRLLEAVLEDDDEPSPKRSATRDRDAKSSKSEEEAVNGVEAEDRKVVLKFVQSIRARLAALRKKMQIMAKRNSMSNVPAPLSKSPIAAATNTTTPAIATTPPQ